VSSVKVEDKEEGSQDHRQVQGLGRLLKEERERRGLSYEAVSERTRLRSQMIMAIENEEWDRLPSPAFVRGFLRSYAKVLSLDEEKVLGSYGKNVRVETDHLPTLRGEPLRDRPRRSFFLLWMLAAVVALFALWKIYGPIDSNLPVQTESSPPAKTETAKGQSDATRAPETPAPPPTAPQERVEAAKAETEKVDPAAGRAAMAAPEMEPKPGPHLLKGKVNARTWAKIYVDDLAPREYMLQPGQQPNWSVSKGFYMIIGNAGGIELEWDGQPVAGLGTPGQVVRLRMPKGFRHSVEGN
jgi:cytoskeleton protein RodZ